MSSTLSLGTTNLIGMISCGTTGKIWRPIQGFLNGNNRVFHEKGRKDQKGDLEEHTNKNIQKSGFAIMSLN